MLRLDTSVGVANILLWGFTEVFVVLMTFQATRLYARHSLDKLLMRGKKISMRSSTKIIDSLPYNSDLQPVPSGTKISLTAVRIGVIAISVYLGYALDGVVRREKNNFDVRSSIDVAKALDSKLTENSGEDIAAMAKLSCLCIKSNSDVELYKGYIDASGDILCEDGFSTQEKEVLLAANIRPLEETPTEGQSMAGIKLFTQLLKDDNAVPGLSVTAKSITYSALDSSGKETGDNCRIVLLEKKPKNICEFGFRRSAGSEFVDSVDLRIATSCDVQVVEYSRMLGPKPRSMPPRMAFLHQVIDATVVSHSTNTAPTRMGKEVIASITTIGLVAAIAVALLSTVGSLVMWWLLRRRRTQDLTSPQGMALVWGCEKYGRGVADLNGGDLFIGFDKKRQIPYLGSHDGIPEPAQGTKSRDVENTSEGFSAEEKEKGGSDDELSRSASDSSEF